MLSVTGLNCWFPDPDSGASPDREIQVLENITISVEKGQTVALVGESGSGKSVTALSILRLLEENSTARVTGTILFENHDILTYSMSDMRTIRGNQISMIFQEPMTSLNPVYTIGNQLMEPLLHHQKLDKKQARLEAISLLERTEIDHPEKRLTLYPHQLSGGQRQRIMIAMALACKPKLLIADEPTTALDVMVQSQILKLLQTLQKDDGMAILLITHDLTMVRKQADFIYIMKDGTIVEEGTVKKIFSSPDSSYTKQLIEAIPPVKHTDEMPPDPILSVNKLNCHFKLYDGWSHPFKRKFSLIRAVDDVELVINRGTTCGVIGESGSGKTTLGLVLLKLVQSTGSIRFKNENIQQLTSRQMLPFRNMMQIVFQDPYSSLSPRMSVGEIIEEGLLVHHRKLDKEERRKRVFKALEEVGLSHQFSVRYPHEFSGGQRQRIAIARAIILKPELLILDEPTSALDLTIQGQIIALLQNLQEKHNLTYIFISHDLRVIRAVSDQIIVMKHGRIIESGSADHVFSNPKEEYTRELFDAALVH